MSETDAGAQIQVNGIFATPVAILMLTDSAAVNEALKATILAREQSHPSTSHSNLGGWQSSWDFAEWSGPAGQQVLGAARHVADQLTSDRQGQKRKIDWKVNAWTNVNRESHGNEFHTHPGAFWSGCYYVDDGGVGADPSLGGQFEIQDPRGVAPAMYAPGLAFAVPGGQSCGASELVTPRGGMILMFPSWLSHAVRPYTGGGTRISIAFNFSL